MTRKVMKIWLASALTLTATEAATASEATDSIGARNLDEVVVTGNSARQRLSLTQIGAEHIELSKLGQTPSFAGERDIIKSLALLPGVRSEGDGGGGFEVRGGNASQNLVMLDGMTLFNPAHVMGIFSTFNDDALGGATLYKGPLPAAYGGASSAVLETTLAPGDMKRFHGAASIGILAARIKAEGPIVADRLSMAVNARRSYVDAFLKMVPQYRSTVMNFYDVSARLRFTPEGGRHIVDGAFFISHDNMAVGDLMGLYWGNLAGSVNWTARCSDKLTLTTTAAATHFDPKMEMDIMDDNRRMLTYIHAYSLNERIRLRFNDNHSAEIGLRSELFKVKSAEWATPAARELELRSLSDNALWGAYSGSFADRLSVEAGVRLNLSTVVSGRHFSDFITLGSGVNGSPGATYFSVEPRLSLRYSLTPCHSLKAGAGRSSQNLHAIRSTATSFPFDRYALTSANVRPERAWQYGLGYNGMTAGGDFDWSVEAYYRDMTDVYDYRDGYSSFSDIMLENIILGGKGRSYGAELMVRKNSGRLTGWVSYTLSHTQTRIPGINDGNWYDASNDRRNDLAVTAIYRLSDRWNLSAAWIFMSGRPLTAPDVKYEIDGATCYYYSRRNAYKTPPVHRLDLSATYSRRGRRFAYEWSFGIFNAYCRYNPYIVYFEDDPDKPSGTRAVQQSMYGLIPSVSYTIKF